MLSTREAVDTEASVSDRDDDDRAAPAEDDQSRADWLLIRQRYVEGVARADAHEWPTLEEVAEHFELSPDRVRKVSAKEGWVARRRQWQSDLDRERQRRKIERAAVDLVDLDDAAISVAKIGLRLCVTRLLAMVEGPLLARELVSVARSAELFQRIGLAAVGPLATSPAPLLLASGPDVGEVLCRDDPDRLARVLLILQEAQVIDLDGLVEDEGD